MVCLASVGWLMLAPPAKGEVTFLNSWGNYGTGDGQFDYPSGVAVSPTGQVYVADTLNHRIQRFFDSEAWVSGTNEFVDPNVGPTDVGVGTGQSLGQTLDLDVSKGLVVGGTTSIEADGTLALNGGSINTGSFVVASGGTFTHDSGTLMVVGTFDPVTAGGYRIDGTDYPTVQLTGGSAMLSLSGNLRVAEFATGRLQITNGGSVENELGYIGYGTASDGTVTVDGSTWTNTGSLYVGGSPTDGGGSGILTAQSGGTVDVSATLKVWGPGTVNLNGGTVSAAVFDMADGDFNFNSGTLNDTNDLTVSPGDNILGGTHNLAFGRHLQVDGTTTLADVLTLDGGTFSTGGLVNPELLEFKNGTLQLTGAGGLTIGAAGPFGASLAIDTGQNLEVTNLLTVDADATLSLAGGTVSAGASVNSGRLHGSGTLSGPLTNNAGGEIQGLAGNNLVLTGAGNTNNGQITLSGGQVHFTQDLTNGTTGLVIGNGTLRADSGVTNDGDMAFSATTNLIGNVTNSDGSTIISAGGTTTCFDDVVNNGVIRTRENSFSVYFGYYSGNGNDGTGTVIMEGDLNPGSSAGTMAFGGDLSFGPAASLEIEIGGTGVGQFDRLNIAGTASLSGRLDVELIDPNSGDNLFVPSAGDSFPIISAAAGFGGTTFATQTLPELPDGLFWSTDYGTTLLTLGVLPLGDVTGDGQVNELDIDPFIDLLLNGPYHIAADMNEDGVLNGRDCAAFVATVQGSGSTQPVPEPATLWLTAIALLCVLWWRRTAG